MHKQTTAFNSFLILLVVPITFILGSCQSMLDPIGTLLTSAQGLTSAELRNEAVVFGRIRWINNGEERTDYRNDYGWNIWPLYFHVEDKKHGTLSVTETGYFAWQLPAGTYILYQAKWFDAISGQRRLPLRLTFKAAETGKAYCIGTLTFDIHSKRDAFGLITIISWQYHIDGTCDQEREWFQKRYSKLNIPIENSRLIHDNRIPDNITALENQQNFSDFMQSIYFLLLPVQ